MFRLVSIALICLVALPSSGRTQEAGYQITAPSGWTADFSNGLDIYMPPEGTKAGASILLMPVQPVLGDLAQQTQATLKSIETSMKLTNPRYLPLKREKSSDAEFVYLGATFSSPSGEVYVLFMSRAEKASVGSLLFLTTSQDAVSRYGRVASEMFTSMRLTGQTVQNQQTQSPTPPPPSTQQQQASGRVPPAEGATIPNPHNVTIQDLVGIWVGETSFRHETFSFGSYTDSSGTIHNTMTSDFHAPLGSGGEFIKIRPDGSYELYHNFTYLNCGHIRHYAGTLSIQNGKLVMRPTEGHELKGPLGNNGACQRYEDKTIPAPEAFSVELVPYLTVRGLPTYRLFLNNVVSGGANYVVDRLDGRPLPNAVPPMTRLYTPGTGHPAGDLQGTWEASEEGYRAVLQIFLGGRYELNVQRADVLYTPVCSKNLSFQEQGEVYVGGQINPNDNKSETGAMTLKPAQSRLTVDVLNCGEDNGRGIYNLSLGPRYLRWFLTMQNSVNGAPRTGDKLNIVCPDEYEKANTPAWGFLSCPEKAGQVYGGYVRR
jgi:hypothetical protein